MMSDEKPIEPMTDDAIIKMVELVQAAEVMAATMGCPVSRAYEIMLRSFQVMTRITNGRALAAFEKLPTAKTPQ
jgi:hypothetical protein